jgi:hypothetical protein
MDLENNCHSPHYSRGDRGIMEAKENCFLSSINITPKAKINLSNITISHHCITIALSKYTPPSVLSGTFGAHRGALVKHFPGLKP